MMLVQDLENMVHQEMLHTSNYNPEVNRRADHSRSSKAHIHIITRQSHKTSVFIRKRAEDHGNTVSSESFGNSSSSDENVNEEEKNELYEDTSSVSSSNNVNTEGKVTEEQKSLYSEIVKMTKSEGRKV